MRLNGEPHSASFFVANGKVYLAFSLDFYASMGLIFLFIINVAALFCLNLPRQKTHCLEQWLVTAEHNLRIDIEGSGNGTV